MLKNEPKLAIVAVHTEENEPPKVQESPEKILFQSVENLVMAATHWIRHRQWTLVGAVDTRFSISNTLNGPFSVVIDSMSVSIEKKWMRRENGGGGGGQAEFSVVVMHSMSVRWWKEEMKTKEIEKWKMKNATVRTLHFSLKM